MNKDEAKHLLRVARMFKHGVIEFKDGSILAFPNNKLKLDDLLWYDTFREYYLDYALTFFPDEGKENVKHIYLNYGDDRLIWG